MSSLVDTCPQQTTLLVHKITNTLIPVDANWDTLEETIRDREGHTGLDAIDASFSNRLAYLASQVKWDRASAEFRYLCANHYRLCAEAYLAENTVEAGTAIAPEKFGKVQAVGRLYDFMNGKLDVPIRSLPNEYSNHYKQLLQYVVYSDPTSEQYKTAVSFLRRNFLNSNVTAQLRAMQEHSGHETVQEVFTEAILTPPDVPTEGQSASS